MVHQLPYEGLYGGVRQGQGALARGGAQAVQLAQGVGAEGCDLQKGGLGQPLGAQVCGRVHRGGSTGQDGWYQ